MKHRIFLFEVGESTVRVEVKSENGDINYFELGGLPTEGPAKQAMINEAVSRFLAHKTFRREHEALSDRIAELTAKIGVGSARTANLNTRSSPPVLAELLISNLAPKNTAQAQLGDLQEIFETNVARFGERQARRMYWIEVARSFGPLLWQWLKRVGFFTVLIDYFRSKFGF